MHTCHDRSSPVPVGVRGTSEMACHVFSRPEASLVDAFGPMSVADCMMSVFSSLPRPWLLVVMMGQPFWINLHQSTTPK